MGDGERRRRGGKREGSCLTVWEDAADSTAHRTDSIHCCSPVQTHVYRHRAEFATCCLLVTDIRIGRQRQRADGDLYGILSEVACKRLYLTSATLHSTVVSDGRVGFD